MGDASLVRYTSDAMMSVVLFASGSYVMESGRVDLSGESSSDIKLETGLNKMPQEDTAEVTLHEGTGDAQGRAPYVGDFEAPPQRLGKIHRSFDRSARVAWVPSISPGMRPWTGMWRSS